MRGEGGWKGLWDAGGIRRRLGERVGEVGAGKERK